jgi:hypothetical protein
LITNAADLSIALQQLSQFADTLEGMRMHAENINSRTFPTLSQVYINRIREINTEIREYLRLHPEVGEYQERTSPATSAQLG